MKRFTLMMLVALIGVTAFAKAPGLKISSRSVQKRAAAVQLKGFQPAAQFTTNRAAEDYTIITEAPEGEVKTYKRAGDDFYVSNGAAYRGTQSGTVTMVFADNNEVYILNPVCGYNQGTYAKATLSEDGKTITMPLGQHLYYSSTYDATVATFMAEPSGNTFVPNKVITEVTYTIEGETITLNGTSEDQFLSAFWTDDDSWSGYGEWNTVLTEYTPDYTLVTLPEGVETVEMPLSGFYFASLNDYQYDNFVALDTNVKVAKVDNTFYIQGLIHLFPEAWVKGELGEDVYIEIPATYVGNSENGPAYAMGYSSTGVAPIYLSYDAESGNMELDGYVMLSSSDLENTLDVIYTALFIGTRPALVEVPEGAVIEELPLKGTYYDGSSSSEITGTVRIAVDNGNNIYMQGLFAEAPEGWIKGSFNEDKTKVIFPYGQYVGLCTYGSVYAVGDQEGEEEDEYVVGDIVFSYNETKNVYTADNVIYSNGKPNQIYYYSLLANVVIGNECDEIWVAKDQGYENTEEVTELNIAEGITAVADKGSSSTTPKYYDLGEALRLYAGNTLTISSVEKIGKIEFTMTGSSKQMLLEANVGMYSLDGKVGTWTGEANEIVFTVPAGSGNQARIQSIKIWYFDYATTLVVVPEGVVCEPYMLKAMDTYYQEEVSYEVQVGFDGNNVYFQGLSSYLPDSWVRGQLDEDGNVTIPNWYLGVYSSWGGDYDLIFSGATFAYDKDANKFTCAEGYQTIVDGTYYMDEVADVTITKINDIAATPATPSIVSFSGSAESTYRSVLTNVPTTDVDGNDLMASKLFYTIWVEKGNAVEQITFSPDLYEMLTEDMTEIPYGFTDSWDFTSGGRVYLNQSVEEIQSWTKIGIQSIYYGGGERKVSEMGWFENPMYETTTGISALKANDLRNAVIYNLAGQRIQTPQKGLNIINGKKVVVK